VQQLTVRNSYKFKLPGTFIILEPQIDIVSLTRPELGLNQYPVRIVSLKEDQKTGLIDIEAEDIGYNSTPGFNTQPPGGVVIADGGDLPQSVNTPFIFEPTSTMLGGLPEVWIGTSGQLGNFNWGGCHVYYSEDGGNSYNVLAEITQPATQGSLIANLAAY